MINAQYRVSRYAPGADLDNTWTGYSDIGSEYGGYTLTEDEYLEVENKYLYAHSVFLQQAGVQRLTALDVEVGERAPERWKSLRDDDELSVEDALQLLRQMLRERVYARLEVPDRFFLHVGYDMISFVGLTEPAPYAVEQARGVGLFVDEDFPSPITPDPAERFWWLDDGLPVRRKIASFDRESGEPLEEWDVPADKAADVLAAITARKDDPHHWDKYVLSDEQAARILAMLGLRADPARRYTQVTYNP